MQEEDLIARRRPEQYDVEDDMANIDDNDKDNVDDMVRSLPAANSKTIGLDTFDLSGTSSADGTTDY